MFSSVCVWLHIDTAYTFKRNIGEEIHMAHAVEIKLN